MRLSKELPLNEEELTKLTDEVIRLLKIEFKENEGKYRADYREFLANHIFSDLDDTFVWSITYKVNMNVMALLEFVGRKFEIEKEV